MRYSDLRTQFFSPLGRSTLIASIFAMLFFQIVCSWVFLRFLHSQSQYRSLSPELYDMEVLTADEFLRMSDPEQREVKLSGGRKVIKTPIWNEIMLPNYKPTQDGNQYVLVTTKGTAHVVPYVEHWFVLFGFVSMCGVVAALWNQGLVARELRPKTNPSDAEAASSG